jgi:hypothetical protein
MMQQRGIRGDGRPDRVGVVQEQRRDGWVIEFRASLKKEAEAASEAIGPHVLF